MVAIYYSTTNKQKRIFFFTTGGEHLWNLKLQLDYLQYTCTFNTLFVSFSLIMIITVLFREPWECWSVLVNYVKSSVIVTWDAEAGAEEIFEKPALSIKKGNQSSCVTHSFTYLWKYVLNNNESKLIESHSKLNGEPSHSSELQCNTSQPKPHISLWFVFFIANKYTKDKGF